MGNYDIRMFRNTISSYIKQSTLEPEIKLLVLKDLTAQEEKEADALVVREAAEIERAAQLKQTAEQKKSAVQKESEVGDNGN